MKRVFTAGDTKINEGGGYNAYAIDMHPGWGKDHCHDRMLVIYANDAKFRDRVIRLLNEDEEAEQSKTVIRMDYVKVLNEALAMRQEYPWLEDETL